MNHATRLTLAACLTLVACQPSFDMPSGAQLQCDALDACPTGYVCRLSLGLCMPNDADSTPPVLVASSVTPNPADLTATLEVSLEVDRALLFPPTVWLDVVGEPRFSYEGGTGQTYTFSLPANAGVPGSHSIFANLTSEEGGVADAVLIDTVVLDFEGPAIAGRVQASPAIAGRDTSISFRVTANEALRAAPTLRLLTTDGDALLDAPGDPVAVDARTYDFTYVVSGDEPEGALDIEVTLVDDAGNPRTVVDPRVLTLDLNGPKVLAGTESARLIPAAQNPLLRVNAVTHGTTVELFFALDEPVAAESVPVVTVRGDDLELTRTLTAGTTYVYTLTWPNDTAPEPHAARTVDVTTVDIYGNEATTALEGVFSVDTEAPEAPDVEATPALLTLHRAPWGDGLTAEAELSLHVEADAAAGGTTIIVSSAAGELGRGTMAATPEAFTIPLRSIDERSVWLHFVDGAGNRSDVDPLTPEPDASEIVAITWTATLTHKVASDSLANPHRFETRPFVAPVLFANGTELGEAAGIALDDEGSVSTTGAGFWRPVAASAFPSRRFDAAVVHDPARGVMVATGGSVWNGTGTVLARTDLWQREGQVWRSITTSDLEGDGNPTLSDLLVYDVAGGALLLAPSGNGPTWLQTGTSWRRIAVPASQALPASGARAVTYDAGRHKPFMYVGPSQRTFTWSGTAWEELCTSAACMATRPPTASASFRLVYDAAHREVLALVGNALWAFTETGMWEERCTTPTCQSSRPASRNRYAMAYDPVRGRTVVYGGCGVGSSPFCNASYLDTWEWDGTAWSCPRNAVPNTGFSPLNLCNAGFGSDPDSPMAFSAVPTADPRQGSGASLIFDPDLQQLLLVFGQGIDGSGDYVWTWDGDAWQRRSTALPKAFAAATTTVTLEDFTGVLFFGGRHSSGVSDQTWAFDGTSWRQLATTCGAPPCAPPGRSHAALVFDPSADKAILFGGKNAAGTALGDTWSWSPSEGWLEVCDSPAACTESLPASGVVRGTFSPEEGAVMFTNGAQSRWFKAGAWENPCSATPCAPPFISVPGAVVWDDVRAQLLMRGGVDGMGSPANATYAWQDEWVSLGWAVARQENAAAFDVGRGVVFTYGGRAPNPMCVHCTQTCSPNNDYCSELGVFDGAWTNATPLTLPTYGDPGPRGDVALTYDPVHERMLLHGGRTHNSSFIEQYLDDTWAFESGSRSRPMHLFFVSFSAAAAPTAVIEELSVHWVVGGRGELDGVETLGASLWLWDGRQWVPTHGDNTASPEAPEALTWSSTTDPTLGSVTSQDLAAMAIGAQRVLTFAVTPRGTGGPHPGQAELVTDSPKVTITYRR